MNITMCLYCDIPNLLKKLRHTVRWCQTQRWTNMYIFTLQYDITFCYSKDDCLFLRACTNDNFDVIVKVHKALANIFSFLNVLVLKLHTWVQPMLEVHLRAFLPLKLAHGPRNEPIYNMNILICGRLQNYDIYLGKLIVTLKLVFYFPRSQISWIQNGKFHLRPVIELFIAFLLLTKFMIPFFSEGPKEALMGQNQLINVLEIVLLWTRSS